MVSLRWGEVGRLAVAVEAMICRYQAMEASVTFTPASLITLQKERVEVVHLPDLCRFCQVILTCDRAFSTLECEHHTHRYDTAGC